LVKNGTNGVGNPKYKCKSCNFSGVIATKRTSAEKKDLACACYLEKSSLRGIGRVFNVSGNTICSWVKKKAETVLVAVGNIANTLLSFEENDVLELDELCSFVYCKKRKNWLWIALCKRTRQVVAKYQGDRSAKSCQALWNLVPESYQNSTTYSDFYAAYEKIITTGKHTSVGKDTGKTNHVERWNCTLRQRLGRFVRKTLSFSKSVLNHELFTTWFIK
jgi:IS1 family transposase